MTSQGIEFVFKEWTFWLDRAWDEPGYFIRLFKSLTIPFGLPSPNYCLYCSTQFCSEYNFVRSTKFEILSFFDQNDFVRSIIPGVSLYLLHHHSLKKINLVFPDEMSVSVFAPSLFLKNEQSGATVDTPFRLGYFEPILESCSFFIFGSGLEPIFVYVLFTFILYFCLCFILLLILCFGPFYFIFGFYFGSSIASLSLSPITLSPSPTNALT